MTIEFRAWPKTPRLNGASMVITEKIDGTNACIIVTEDGRRIGAQSRNRLISPGDDNVFKVLIENDNIPKGLVA